MVLTECQYVVIACSAIWLDYKISAASTKRFALGSGFARLMWHVWWKVWLRDYRLTFLTAVPNCCYRVTDKESISSGTFPTKWKLSSVVPIPKSSDKGSPKNYHPISLLLILSRQTSGETCLWSTVKTSEPIHSLVSNEENQLLLLYWKLLITGCNCWRVGGT